MKNQIGYVNETPYHMDFAKFIQDNSLIKDLVKIESIKFNHKTIGLTEFSQYQDKWKDTI
ncbi:MAG: hypothetical protein GY756_04045 [bacterium]|nr:hypothetical protein [bacterium]